MQPRARSPSPSRIALPGREGPRHARHARPGGIHAGAMHAGATRRGVVVLDRTVPDPDAFLAAVPGFDIPWLGPCAEPLAAPRRLLGGGRTYTSLHLLSHGRPGALVLAGHTVDGRRLRERGRFADGGDDARRRVDRLRAVGGGAAAPVLGFVK